MRRPVVLIAAAAMATVFTGCATAPVGTGAGGGDLSETAPAIDLSTADPMPPGPATPGDHPPTTGPDLTISPSAVPMDCPDSGIRITSGGVDGAMGLRFLTLSATNCGAVPVDLSGYPQASMSDGVTAIVAEPGGLHVSDPGERPVLLEPGDEACTVVTWRTLVEAGGSVSAQEFSLAPLAGQVPQVIAQPVDLGTTGVWYTTAWYQGELPEMVGPCGTVSS